MAAGDLAMVNYRAGELLLRFVLAIPADGRSHPDALLNSYPIHHGMENKTTYGAPLLSCSLTDGCSLVLRTSD
jgi:hypothetical protein